MAGWVVVVVVVVGVCPDGLECGRIHLLRLSWVSVV